MVHGTYVCKKVLKRNIIADGKNYIATSMQTNV